jgi:hypothetical protein
MSTKCLCGCGTIILPDSRGRQFSYVKGHQLKSRKPIPVYVCKNSACGKTFTPKPLRRTRPRLFCSDECRIAVTGHKYIQRVCAYEGCKKLFTVPLKGPNQIFCSLTCSGNHYGLDPALAKTRELAAEKAKVKKDTMPQFQPGPDHATAKFWTIRSPAGVSYTFHNLVHFVREHPDLFIPEDINWKLTKKGVPVKCRAVGGLYSLSPGRNKKTVNGSWKGWTFVSMHERRFNDGDDLLTRQVS